MQAGLIIRDTIAQNQPLAERTVSPQCRHRPDETISGVLYFFEQARRRASADFNQKW
jgi:hypothetical protein